MATIVPAGRKTGRPRGSGATKKKSRATPLTNTAPPRQTAPAAAPAYDSESDNDSDSDSSSSSALVSDSSSDGEADLDAPPAAATSAAAATAAAAPVKSAGEAIGTPSTALASTPTPCM